MTVPHNDCFCDRCLLDYHRFGLVLPGSPAWQDVQQLLDQRPKEYHGQPITDTKQ